MLSGKSPERACRRPQKWGRSADTLGSPYVLTQQWIERDQLDEGMLAPIASTSMEDFDRVLGEVVRASGWGPGFLEKNPESPEA